MPIKPTPKPKPKPTPAVLKAKTASQRAANKVYNTQGTINRRESNTRRTETEEVFTPIITQSRRASGLIPGTQQNKLMTAQNKALDSAKAKAVKAHNNYLAVLKASKTKPVKRNPNFVPPIKKKGDSTFVAKPAGKKK